MDSKIIAKSDITQQICSALSVSEDDIKKSEKLYKSVLKSVPYDYLAHLIRTLELYIRKEHKNILFRITTNPFNADDFTTLKDLAWSEFSATSFDIYYDSKLDDLQKRILISHELGHLFIDALSKKKGNSLSDSEREKIASLFGVITLIHKFYLSKEPTPYKSEQNIITEYTLLLNRTNGLLNVSTPKKKKQN